MRGKLFVFSELYYPDESATGYVLTRIAEGLAKSLTVHVLCGPPSTYGGSARAPLFETRKGVIIERCPATTLDKNIMLLRLLNVVTVSLSIFWKALWRMQRGDSVLVVTNPPTLPFVALAASRLRSAKCLLLIHDVFPEALTAAKMLQPGGFPVRFLDGLYQLLYRKVDRIVVLGRDMLRLVMQKLNPDDLRVHVITNWADLEEILPAHRAHNVLLKKLNLADKFVVQYAGNIGRMHGLEVLLEAAKILKGRTDIHFLLVGSGAKKQWLESLAKKEGLNDVSFLSPQPRSDLADVLNASDVAIISFIPGMAGVSVPSKMYNILAAGKPIIALVDHDSETAMVVREEQIGWVVPPGRPDLVAAALEEASGDRQCLLEMGKRARAAAEGKYSFQRVIESYRELLENV